MSLNSKVIQNKINKGLSKAGVGMILKKTTAGVYDPTTSQTTNTTIDVNIIGLIFDLSSQEKQTLGGAFSEHKKIMFGFVEGGTPVIDDQIWVKDKKYIITEVKNTLPLNGEDLMYQVLVKL
jgi:hypothetical protein